MRPATLYETCERVRGGQSRAVAISEFLDTFYSKDCPSERLAAIEKEPNLTGDRRLDAFVAAAAEYLAKQYALPSVPAWVKGESRYLDEPWFTTASTDPGMLEYLTFSSPAEFKSRNVFTEERPLRRASQNRPVSRLP